MKAKVYQLPAKENAEATIRRYALEMTSSAVKIGTKQWTETYLYWLGEYRRQLA